MKNWPVCKPPKPIRGGGDIKYTTTVNKIDFLLIILYFISDYGEAIAQQQIAESDKGLNKQQQ